MYAAASEAQPESAEATPGLTLNYYVVDLDTGVIANSLGFERTIRISSSCIRLSISSISRSQGSHMVRHSTKALLHLSRLGCYAQKPSHHGMMWQLV